RSLRRAYEFARRSPHNIAPQSPTHEGSRDPALVAHIARSGGVFVWHSPRPSYWETKGKSGHEYAIRNRIVASDAVVHRQPGGRHLRYVAADRPHSDGLDIRAQRPGQADGHQR